MPYRSVVFRLTAARLISWSGGQAAYIALIALVYQRSGGSGAWISAALLASLGARVAASPWAGSLGDYFDRRLVMIGSDLAAAASFVAITRVHSLPLIVLLAAVAGIAESPFGPASGGLVTMIVPEDRRGWANGTLSIGTSSGTLLGAALGGLLVAAFGASTAFLLNAASFVASAAFSATITGHFASGARGSAEHAGIWRGLRLLAVERVLRLSTAGLALVALAVGMTNVVELPFFVAIGAGSTGFGVGVAAWGAGQILGGRLAARVVDARLERRALIAGAALVSLAIGLSGAIPAFAVVALLFVAGGLGNQLLNLGLVLTVQRWAAQQLQSRALAAAEAVINTGIGISLLVGGMLLGPLGPRGVFVLAGGLGVLAVLICLRIPREPSPIQPREEPVTTFTARSAFLDPDSIAPLPA